MTIQARLGKSLLSVAAGVLLAGSLILWSIARGTPHLDKIADEVGSVPHQLVGIYPSHTGASVLYYQETEKGMGTFLADTATGKTKLIYEEPEKGYSDRFHLMDWSGNDSLLLYSTRANSDVPDGGGGVYLRNGITGELITNFPADSFAGDAQFAWLPPGDSPNAFMCSTFTHRSWLVYEKKLDGTWAQTRALKRFGPGKLPFVRGISSHAVAWLDGSAIWTYDLNSGISGKVWETTNKVTSYYYTGTTGNYTIACQDAQGLFQIDYRPPMLGEETGTVMNVVRPPPARSMVSLATTNGHPLVTVRLAGAEPVSFEWDGMVQYCKLGGDNVFFTGNRADGVPGVFRFDTHSQSVGEITSVRNTPMKYAKFSAPTTGLFTNRDGRVMGYHLWPPVNVGDRKKHAIVVGEGVDDWQQYPQLAANAGWFYAQADITTWDIWRFPDEVAALYDQLSKNPNVDTNKVVVIAFCAEAATVDRLEQAYPGLARGLVLSFPFNIKPSQAWKADSILFLGGVGDNASPINEILAMHDAAWNSGIDSSLQVLEGVTHISHSAGAEREQGRQFTRFLNQNE